MKDWIYNEFNHVGVDYSKKNNTDIYDDQMESFRNYETEVKIFADKLGVETKGLTVADIGCGTGAFCIHASKHFKKVYAVDVSKEMLKITSSKADSNKINNIEFINSGFLNFKLPEKVDVIFTKWAFHHLPDFWKQAALLNINKMMKPGGVLFLADVVFKFDPDYEKNIESLLTDLSKDFDNDFIEETKIHIRDEYSTFDWILRGLIERAGFIIESTDTKDSLLCEYFCRKI